MGMNQGTVGALQQGVDMVGDVMNVANGMYSGRSVAANEAREKGGILELDAKGNALDMQQRAAKDAQRLRLAREDGRAKRNTGWGASNLAMSGSKKLIRESSRIKDAQAEDDILFAGQMEADEMTRDGRHKANLLRINGGSAPVRSTLLLGSKIYGPRR
jgi:hypothetical protein